MFQILLHPDLYSSLRHRPEGTVERLRRRLQRLRQGQWGGGTRVKRLKGLKRPVFEARLSSGDRLLFTVIRSADPAAPESLAPYLQVWDLVPHDDVERAARRNLAPEAEFLELEAVEELALEEPPPAPEASFDDLEETGEPLLSYLLPPEGFIAANEAARGEGLAGAERWYRLDGSLLEEADRFQRLLDSGAEELELKLTGEQYQVLAAPGPVLVAGSSGSGKTTLAVHRLFREAWAGDHPSGGRGRRLLYLSYSSWLVDLAARLYEDLVRAQGRDPEGPEARRRRPSFLTFDDLYRRILEEEVGEAEASPVTFEAFEEWLGRTGRRLPAALVWEELRSILKGACLDPGRPFLSEEDYFDLGRKRAPLFTDQRPEIFTVARSYQGWLEEAGRRDQIDLCRQAFRRLGAGAVVPYDAVVCDEVQDLTELEVAFVVALARDGDARRLFLAGDTQQIVNPTGFRWAEVRRILHRGRLGRAPRIRRLRRNFRSVRPLVELANRILGLRRRLFGVIAGEGPEEAVVEGPFPVQVVDGEEAVLGALRGFGARCAVLVMDDEEGERLRGRLGTSRIFHVREAKGLEFESVVLWKTVSASSLASFPQRPPDSAVARDLQHLYVAITRARRHLAVYEGETRSSFWSRGELEGALEEEAAATLERLFRSTASPEEWAREGEDYLRRGRPLQAAECFRRAGLEDRELRARAEGAEGREDWEEALRLWTVAGDAPRRAGALERLGRRREALAIYLEEGLEEAARRCRIRLQEGEGRWREAAEAWMAAGSPRDSARCLRRAGDRAAAQALELEAARSAGDRAAEARAWLVLGDYGQAEKAFLAAGLDGSAALARGRRQAAAGRWREAEESFRDGGNGVRARRMKARALEAEGDPAAAAEVWRSLGALLRASRLYRRAGRVDEADALLLTRIDLALPQVERVAELEAAGELEAALTVAEARLEGLASLAPELPWLALNPVETGAVAEQAELEAARWRLLAARAAAAGRLRDAARAWHQAGDGDRSRAALGSALAGQSLHRRALGLHALGQEEEARALLEAAGDDEGALRSAARALEQGGAWRPAAELWEELKEEAEADRCRAHAARLEGDRQEAARLFRRAGFETLAELLQDPEKTGLFGGRPS